AWRRDTFPMTVPNKRGSLFVAAIVLILSAGMLPLRADEIQLKDGKKLYGVIVAYEDNMFKVKTDFGFVLVEKDKIAKIVPSTPVGQGTAKQDAAAQSPKPPSDPQPQAEPAVASSEEASATPTKASTKSVTASPAAKADKASPKVTNVAVKPESPAGTTAPAIKGAATAPATGLASGGGAASPKAPEPPPNREEIRGNLYTNYTHGFRMYKAPSWN